MWHAGGMFVGDEQVCAVIRELREAGARVSGARVRRELTRRFGCRGGVDRIYRLLRESTAAKPAEGGEVAARLRAAEAAVAAAQAERDAALERAALAEHREEAHQQKWAREIDALRQELAAAKGQSPAHAWLPRGGDPWR